MVSSCAEDRAAMKEKRRLTGNPPCKKGDELEIISRIILKVD